MNGEKAKFTEGPWTIGYDDRSGREYIVAGGKAIFAARWGCACCKDTSNLKPVEKANLRLGASAPVLYAALTGLVEAVRRDSDESGNGISGFAAARLTDAFAALRKATGASE